LKKRDELGKQNLLAILDIELCASRGVNKLSVGGITLD
jgi:hypothetical protein